MADNGSSVNEGEPMDDDNVVGIRLPPDLNEEIMRTAVERGRTVEEIISTALWAYVTDDRNRRR